MQKVRLAREQILAIPEIKGVEDSEIFNDVSESEIENLIESINKIQEEHPNVKFYEYLALSSKYLSMPFRYVDEFGSDPAAHAKRREWEREAISSEIKDEYDRNQISLNNLSFALTGLLIFLPKEKKGEFDDIANEANLIEGSYLSEVRDENDKTIEFIPYHNLSLDDKRKLVRRVCLLIYKMISRVVEMHKEDKSVD